MRIKAICIICGLFCFLSGCIALPGQEPFGEKTYSGEKAQAIYEDISSSMYQIDFGDWKGYSISSDFNSIVDVYKTEEYTLAYYEISGKDYSVWYDGRLYYYTDDKLFYRDMEWEKLETENFAKEKWDLVRQLLELEDVKLTCKYIPMASDHKNLLKAEYPAAQIDGQQITFAELLFYLDENREFNKVTMHCTKEGENYMSISFFPYEGSTDLQAERKLWSFGRDLGLTEESVPALSQQEENREWSRKMIDSMDFEVLVERAEYAEDLTFPDLPTLLSEMAKEREAAF